MRAFLDLAGMVGCRHAPGPARSRHAPAPPPTRDAHRPEPDRPGGPLDRSLAFIFRSFSFPRKREAAQHYTLQLYRVRDAADLFYTSLYIKKKK